MSLFRKPKKLVLRRVFSSYDEEDVENNESSVANDNKMDVDVPESTSKSSSDGRSRDREKKKDKKSKSSSSTSGKDKEKEEVKEKKSSSSSSITKLSLLSFDDEEEGEVFQVKKSSHSKKVMKMLDKERRKKRHQDKSTSSSRDEYKTVHNSNASPKESDLNVKIKKEKSESSNNIQTEIRTDDFVLVVKKSDPENIILNGRAALCAGKDDMSSEEEDESENGHKFNKPDNFKMFLECGIIPDAAMIHAARKRRQKAREQGDFIAVEEPKDEKKNKRVVSEDGDGDGSDEDEDRIDMSAITGAKEREERREKFYSVQQEDSAEDSDLETKEWENQQLRKGVTGAQLVAAHQESILSQYITQGFSQTFSNAASTENMSTAALLEQAYARNCGFSKPKSSKASIAKPEKATGPRMPQEILKQLSDKLYATRESNYKHISDIEKITTDVAVLKLEYLESEQKAPAAAAKYRFYQEIKCYVTDLIECLDEKIPQIVALEQKALAISSKHSNTLIERRRQDVRDQAKEIADSTSKGQKKNAKKVVEDPDRVRRAAEREGRRTRRRRDREKNDTCESHFDGMSSDDEIADHDLAQYKAQLQQITDEASQLFEDASDEFKESSEILGKFQNWRENDMSTYKEAYVNLCLPKILGPIIRLKHVAWNPMDDNIVDFEIENWFKACVLYGRQPNENEKSLAEDIDVRLIPTLIEKIILPKVTALIDQYWDPLSTTQTFKLVRLISRLGRDYPSLRPTCRQLRTLFQTVLDKIKSSIDNDVFIPVFPKQMQESKSSFFQRQFCSGLKLFRNVISWQGIISDNALKELAISSLLNRYLLSGMRVCTPVDAISKASMIVYTLPRVWLSSNSIILKNLEMFIVLLQNVESQLDRNNPLHLDSIEKIAKILTSLHVGQGSK